MSFVNGHFYYMKLSCTA